MKTIVVLEFTHEDPIPDLADMAACRAYTLTGVDNCEVISTGIKALSIRDEMPEQA